MQLSQTSLVVACPPMAGPSSIHNLPTEQYNQDILSLGLHSSLAYGLKPDTPSPSGVISRVVGEFRIY